MNEKMREEILKSTRFYKEGGSCFECCDYEGMVEDLSQTLTEAYEAGKREERERIERNLRTSWNNNIDNNGRGCESVWDLGDALQSLTTLEDKK